MIVRTHRADAPSLDAYDRYAAVPGLDVTFVCDERAGPVDVGARRKHGFDLARLKQMGLFLHPKLGWRCGDYFYYVAREEAPDYDRYWMIEPDVYINTPDLAGFFGSVAEDPSDFLGIKYGHRGRTWSWYPTVKNDFEEIRGCVFSTSRISGAGIDAMYAARRAASAHPPEPVFWPNDEAFTACLLHAKGFACADFNSTGRTLWSSDSFANGAPKDIEELREAAPDGMIYHPVRAYDNWLEKSVAQIDGMRIDTRAKTIKLRKLTKGLLLDPATEELALIPLVRGADALESPAWLESERYDATATEAVAEFMRRKLKQNFGTRSPEAAIGQAFTVKPLVGTGNMRRSDASDFAPGTRHDIAKLPTGNALPYAWNFDDRTLLATLHMQPERLLERPFLYGAQRELATAAVTLRLDALDALYGPPDADAAPILIFSPGRTGSTLVNMLLRAAIPRSVSEPDTLTQVAQQRKIWSSWTPEDQARLFWHSISPFYRMKLGQPDDGTLAIKLRSQVNGAAPDLVRLFPKATFVFLLRERLAWARSTYRAFNQPAQQVAGKLARSFATLATLRDEAANFRLLSYEEIVAAPHDAVATILGRTPDDDARARIDEAMEADSQAGTAVERDRTGQAKPEEAAWLEEFEAQWAKIRPAALIERLGIDF